MQINIGFIGLLTIVFVTLKLCGVISWSWLWVLSPLWIGALVAIAILLIIVAIAFIEYTQDKRRWKK